MEDIIFEKDIRQFFLGKTLYNKCINGGVVSDKDLMSRLVQLHMRDPIFGNIQISDIVRLCKLKESEYEKMEIEKEEINPELRLERQNQRQLFHNTGLYINPFDIEIEEREIRPLHVPLLDDENDN